jgi:hypothetical protein
LSHSTSPFSFSYSSDKVCWVLRVFWPRASLEPQLPTYTSLRLHMCPTTPTLVVETVLANHFSWLASTCNPPNLCLLSS